MIVHLALPAERYDAQAARQLVDQLESAFRSILSTQSGSPFALLSSPNGSVWKLTVSDAGALSVAKLPGGRPIA